MKTNNDTRQVVVAVTEASPVRRLWRTALSMARDSQSELTVLLLQDDRWHRAASLPFTREISRFGDRDADFTLQRAEALSTEAVRRLHAAAQQLAAESEVRCTIEVVTRTETSRASAIVAGRRSVLVASSIIKELPVFALLERQDCEIVLVESGSDDSESEASGD